MADYAITITEQDVLNASSYIPISAKEKFTRAIAFLCLEPEEIKVDDTPLPVMFRENKKIKSQYLMGILAVLLGKGFTNEKLKPSGEEMGLCMEESEYDAWAASHVFNQLERLKKCKNAEVVNKLFDILYDYKAFEMMLTGAIRDELEARNDPINRALQWFTVSAADAAVKEMVGGELKDIIKNAKGDSK